MTGKTGRREMRTDIARFADVAMYKATPLAGEGKQLTEPRVTVISMTPNPLRVMAAAAEQYRGIPVHDPRDIDRTTATNWFRDMSVTKLQAPLEFIDIHLYLEGVSRAFTHQLVRQRTAVYVQESQRFAVQENAAFQVVEPPSLAGLPEDHPWRVIWDTQVANLADSYNQLINAGMPAEDARGLLPTNIGTRIHWKSNLRNLTDHASSRLCSQAQFEWKIVWGKIIQAIRSYGPATERWQQQEICRLFRPPCYLTGKCEFMAKTDRWCVIRDRVEAHHEAGDPPETWGDIDPRETLHPAAARRSAMEARDAR